MVEQLTLQKKILPPLLRNWNPGPFDHESGALTTELSPLPGTVAGYAAGSVSYNKGGGANRLCMTKKPVFGKASIAKYASELYGLEYYMPGRVTTDVVCALCRNSYSATFMVPGTNRYGAYRYIRALEGYGETIGKYLYIRTLKWCLESSGQSLMFVH